ncbi:hypothetical protein Q7A53_10135 [Halobacillus rhizosphaerae]|uniref:hypothetical protein n=1 Tax=Halobacillus rhizosphaerae TaxID=3064889 RepID=UPI00398AA867
MKNLKHILLYFLMLPAILIGTLAMISYGVPVSIWIQNLFIWLIGTVVCSILLIKNKKNARKARVYPALVIAALLILPFCFEGIDGVHRWLSFGPLTFYIASILLPLLIIQLGRLSRSHHPGYLIGIILFTFIILLLQPDAGQLTSFACGMAIILVKQVSNSFIKLLSLTLTAVFVILSWIFLDDLAPVPYVERIIFLVGDMGEFWLVAGIVSLILLFIPFVIRRNMISYSLGVYFLMTIIVTFMGNFPVPIMGYGTSPIIGYFIAVTWINRDRYSVPVSRDSRDRNPVPTS